MKYDASAIGKNIRKLRRAAEITQARLAKAISPGTTPDRIWAYESGKCLPSVKTLITIADVLNCSMEDIFGNAT